MQEGPKDVGHIDWHLEAPNKPFLGNGHTRAEAALTHLSATLLTLLAVGYWWWSTESTSYWRAGLLLILAYDVLGGVVANSLNSCKRFYHAVELPDASPVMRAMRSSLTFTSFHVHTIVLALAFGFSIGVGVAWYVMLVVSVWAVSNAPLYLRRPLAAALCLSAIVASQTLLPLQSGLEWVVPALFLKLVLGHTVQEEPYRPKSGVRTVVTEDAPTPAHA